MALRVPLLSLLLAAFLSGIAHAGVAVKPSGSDDAQGVLQSIALLPLDARLAALHATLYPGLVVELGTVQANSGVSFLRVADLFPEPDRTTLWQIAQEPQLLRAAPARARAGRDSSVLRERARMLWSRHPALMRSLAALRESEQVRIDALLSSYPLETRAAFRELRRRPEALDLLTRQPALAASLGALYRADPEATESRLAALHASLTRDHAAAIPGWSELPVADASAAQEEPAPPERREVEVQVHEDGSRTIVLDGSIPRASDPPGIRVAWVPSPGVPEVRPGVPAAYTLIGASSLVSLQRPGAVVVYTPAPAHEPQRARRSDRTYLRHYTPGFRRSLLQARPRPQHGR